MINIILDLNPICLHDITGSGILYMIRYLIILPLQAKHACTTKIYPDSLNNILPGNLLIFVIQTQGISPKKNLYILPDN